MYLLYFLAFLPVIGEELSSCTEVWMTKRSSPALRLGGALHQDKAPELEGRDLPGCCSARCDTLVAGLCVTSPPLSPQQGGCACPPSRAGCWVWSAAVPCSGGSSVMSHRAWWGHRSWCQLTCGLPAQPHGGWVAQRCSTDPYTQQSRGRRHQTPLPACCLAPPRS